MLINPGLDPTATPPPGGLAAVAGMPGNAPADMPMPDVQTVENDDGSVDFLDGEPDIDPADAPHDANLAEVLDTNVLGDIAARLIEGIDADKSSNAEMYAIFEAGLKFVSVKPGERMSTPFPGAAGVVHPLLLEAAIRFQATARGEMLPAAGPVRMQVNGDGGPQAEQIATRKRDWLNYYLTTKDEEYYPDFDQMLLLVGMYGSMFRKVYCDPGMRGMPVSRALTPQDLLVSYDATSLHGSGRVTHVQPAVAQADIKRLQLKAWYRDVDLGIPSQDEMTAAEIVESQAEGRTPSTHPDDATYTLYHCHCLLDVEGLEHRGEDGEPTGLPLPYIVTIEPESQQVLRLVRNWNEGDTEFQAREYYVHYQYLPGLGFYGWGLIHLLGSTVDALTMMRRQALNAFTLASFPGGVRTKGARPEDSNNVIGPGEWKEIDTGGLPIQQALMPMPYRDVPASFQPIMSEMLESGQRVGGVADMAVGDGREDALPGTVIALIEKATKVESSVIKRLHTAQRKELRLLAELFGADADAKYDYVVGGARGQALAGDFQDNEDIVPVSDPNIPTQTQRLAQAQGIMQVAQASNGMVDMRAATEAFLRTLGKTDQEIAVLMPQPQQGQPSDPVTEFASVLKGMPLAAGPQQDHAAHIQAHMAQLTTPGLDKTPAYQPLLAHVGDHAGLFYAGEASRLTGIPMLPGQVPPQMEAQVAAAVASVSDQLRVSLAQLAPPTGDPNDAAKIALERDKLELSRQKMALDAHDQDRKAAQATLSEHDGLMKQLLTIKDNEAQRASDAEVNQNETVRALLSLRTAEVEAGAQVNEASIEHDTAIGERLIEHGTTAVRAEADVKVAEHDAAAAKHKAAGERAKQSDAPR